MNRSDFFYDQEVREQELDQVFDDVEDMEQAKIVDFDLWGVIIGLEVTEQTVPNLTVQVSVGNGHDRHGRRIVGKAIEDVDLSSYLPITGSGYSKYVDLYGIDYMDESDPRVDGHSNPLNYRLTEGIDFLVVEGAESSGAPTPPSENMNHLPLSRVLLVWGQTQILNADITDGYRQGAEIAWRKDRLVYNDLNFDFVPGTHEYSILSPETVQLAEQQSIGETGFDANGRSVEDAGAMSMRSGGLGFDMNDNNMTEVGSITFNTGPGTGLNLDGKEIINIGDDLNFATGFGGAQITGDLTQITFSLGSSGGIDLHGRDIFCTDSQDWTGSDISQLSFIDGLGTSTGLAMNDQIIDQAARLILSTGTGPGIDSAGKDIASEGGDLDLSATGTDGDILGVNTITCAGLIQSTAGSIQAYIDVTALNEVLANVNIIADADSSGSGNFKYPATGRKTQTYHINCGDADYGSNWLYSSGAIYGRGELKASAASTSDLAVFPVHLPILARVTEVRAKIYSPSIGSLEYALCRQDMVMSPSTTQPGNRALVSGATKKVSTLAANYETLIDAMTAHVVSESYFYEVAVEATAADVIIYGIEIEYEVETVRAGIL